MRRTLKIESLHANSGLQIHNSKVEDCKSRPAGASTTPTGRPRLGVPDWASPTKFGFARILPPLLENKEGKLVLIFRQINR